MNLSINSLISAYNVQEKRMEFLANNLANVSTFGFKGDRPVFEVTDEEGKPLRQRPALARNASSGGLLPLSYLGRLQNNNVVFTGVKTDFSQGALQNTGNPFDLAIMGSGFFAVSTPDGTRYTRNGHFALNEEGGLVTQDGFAVLGRNGPIQIEKGNVAISKEGAVIVDKAEVDRLAIVDSPQPDLLRKAGGNLFEVAGEPLPTKDPATLEVIQGFLESSNVNIVGEMVTLIGVSKAYETYQKVIHSLNEALSKSVNELGRLS